MKTPSFDIPQVRLPEIKSPAEYAQIALVERIKLFELTLGPDEEMGVYIAGSLAYRVTRIGTTAAMIVFYGVDDAGRRVETYQHHSQINLTLMALAKPDDVEKARRVGFETGPRDA